MNHIRSALLSEHSLEQAKKIAAWAAADKASETELFHLFLSGNFQETQRAAWALSHFAEAQPHAVIPYLSAMIRRCAQDGLPEAAKRTVSRILQFAEIPKEHTEEALNACFLWLENPRESIATRCFSMSALERLSVGEPDLRLALKQLIEYILMHEDCSAGLKSRAHKVLKQISGNKKKRH